MPKKQASRRNVLCSKTLKDGANNLDLQADC